MTVLDDAPIPATGEELDRLRELARRSHQVITSHQDPGGAYPASPTFSAYRGYAWLRDGSFTAEGISRYGDAESADRFHDWVCRVLADRRGLVDDLLALKAKGVEIPLDQMLPTRFTFAGRNGSDPWWDFQTDGYGMWLWSVTTHAERHGRDLLRWLPGLEVAVDFAAGFWDLACNDWWEEHLEHRHTSTLGAIHGGLVAVAGSQVLDADRVQLARDTAELARALVLAEGVVDGHLSKWLGSAAVDGSLPACIVPFGLVAVDDPIATRTLAAVGADLDVEAGVHRFTADVFYGGGQWLLLSALLGWNKASAGDFQGAWRHLRWIAEQATPDGDLPEQVPDHLCHPDRVQEWLDRWGPVATPLLWSHGMYLILADELGLLEGLHP